MLFICSYVCFHNFPIVTNMAINISLLHNDLDFFCVCVYIPGNGLWDLPVAICLCFWRTLQANFHIHLTPLQSCQHLLRFWRRWDRISEKFGLAFLWCTRMLGIFHKCIFHLFFIFGELTWFLLDFFLLKKTFHSFFETPRHHILKIFL